MPTEHLHVGSCLAPDCQASADGVDSWCADHNQSPVYRRKRQPRPTKHLPEDEWTELHERVAAIARIAGRRSACAGEAKGIINAAPSDAPSSADADDDDPRATPGWGALPAPSPGHRNVQVNMICTGHRTL